MVSRMCFAKHISIIPITHWDLFSKNLGTSDVCVTGKIIRKSRDLFVGGGGGKGNDFLLVAAFGTLA